MFYMKKTKLFYLVFAFFLLSSSLQIYSTDDRCLHCNSDVHKSDLEICLKCGRLVKDCDYFHSVKRLTYEDIVNAPNYQSLIDVLFTIRDMYRSKNGSELSLDDIFQKANFEFEQKGIQLPKKGLKSLKDILKRREFNENYIHYYRQYNEPLSFSQTNEWIKFQEFARDITFSKTQKYPDKLRYGVLLVWCGSAVTLLSDGLLTPFGGMIIGIGLEWSMSGALDYEQEQEECQREQEEKAELKEKKKAEKKAKKEAKKEAKRLKKERKNLENN